MGKATAQAKPSEETLLTSAGLREVVVEDLVSVLEAFENLH